MVLIVLVATLSYRAGDARGRLQSGRAESAVTASLNAELVSQRNSFEMQLRDSTNRIEDLAQQLVQHKSTIQILREELATSDRKLSLGAGEIQSAKEQNASLQHDRDELAHQLAAEEASLAPVKDELAAARNQQAEYTQRISNLQARLDQVNSVVRRKEDTIEQQQQFLVSDRDIRELMGARNLYITDVFDIDNQGRTQRPFGRVFYTKGKSLIFYGFDFDQQHGVRNAAFQAWGLRGSDRASYVNMGMFYIDNEANRRWILKFEDPDTLAQINAVFVTMEPKGGSRKPSGKQLLFASLRTVPNHP
jgi:anti-sigma-K factor RskA